MSRVFFDTNLFIYLFEDAGPQGDAVSELLNRMAERGDELVTSAFTLGELLVKPLAGGNLELALQYESALTSPGVHLVAFDSRASRHYARIRVDRSLKGPDAIQLASAASANCDLFVTNDDSLSKKIVPGIQFIVSLERVPI